MSLLIMVLWVMGAAALTSVVTTSRIAAVVAPVVSGLMLSMPSDSLTMYVQWPHALALSVLPGMIAAFIIWGRRLARSSEKNWKDALVHWPLGVFLLVGTVGMAHAHGSALFAFAWTVLIPCIGACMSIIRRPGRNRTVQKVAAGVTATAVVVIPLWLLNSPQLKGMVKYNRSGISWEYAITHALMPLPPLPENIDAFAAGITFAVLTLFGCIRLYTRARTWDSARALFRKRLPATLHRLVARNFIGYSPPAKKAVPHRLAKRCAQALKPSLLLAVTALSPPLPVG